MTEMLKMKPKNLLELTKTEIANWISSFDTVLADCDGVLWHGSVAIDGVPEALALLKSQGKEIYFVTNNGTKTRNDIWKTATAIGYDIPETRIIAPVQRIVEYLQALDFQKKVYIIGGEAIRTALSEVGIESFGPGPDVRDVEDFQELIAKHAVAEIDHDVGAVIVGFDEYFNFQKMLKACAYIGSNPECLFLSTNPDPVHRYPKFRKPGSGAFLSALETCVGRKALQFGKPGTEVCAELVRAGKVVPARTLMIGDVCKVDILFGHKCGFQTLLVGTGHNTENDVKELLLKPIENQGYIPDFYLPSLGDLRKLI